MTILLTGGAGFIGSNFIHTWFSTHNEPVINLDKLTYAGHLANLAALDPDDLPHTFVHGDINDTTLVTDLLAQYNPRAIINFAAESHVDRSIQHPEHFITTNINGTFNLLSSALNYWVQLPSAEQSAFRFIQISTDEVYGSLSPAAQAVSENHPYCPSSPYSASKAASDHLVQAWQHTYGLPTITTHCTNNYGPYHFPEKLIPLLITHAIADKPLPIYGDGQQIRDWLYVTDHCQAIMAVLERGRPGQIYNISGNNQYTNLDIATMICQTLDTIKPRADGVSYAQQLRMVADRPGHDRRYALDASKIMHELGWQPQETFTSGLHKTITWYLANPQWLAAVSSNNLRT